jgi:hypothetical protein
MNDAQVSSGRIISSRRLRADGQPVTRTGPITSLTLPPETRIVAKDTTVSPRELHNLANKTGYWDLRGVIRDGEDDSPSHLDQIMTVAAYGRVRTIGMPLLADPFKTTKYIVEITSPTEGARAVILPTSDRDVAHRVHSEVNAVLQLHGLSVALDTLHKAQALVEGR